jgi:hypothetical protein
MHIIIIDRIVHSHMRVREPAPHMLFRGSDAGRKVCRQVPLQRVDGAVGAEDGRRFSWLG